MSKIIYAAGGVVQNDHGLIAIVYRAKQKDWTLPKGKVERSGETIEQCAVREVYEETGVLASIDRLIGHSQYKLAEGKQKGRLKVVYWFAMDFIQQTDLPLPKDVQKREWHNIEQAYDVLTHKKDHKILEAFQFGPASRG